MTADDAVHALRATAAIGGTLALFFFALVTMGDESAAIHVIGLYPIVVLIGGIFAACLYFRPAPQEARSS
jgi:hypothetical protein